MSAKPMPLVVRILLAVLLFLVLAWMVRLVLTVLRWVIIAAMAVALGLFIAREARQRQ